MLMTIMKINYYIQKNEKYLETFITKGLIKQKNYLKKIDNNNLIFTIISTGKTINFSKKDDPLTFLNKIKKRKITIEEGKESHKDFNRYLKIIRKGNKNHMQQETLANLNMLFNGRNEAINFINGYGSMILEAKKMAAE